MSLERSIHEKKPTQPLPSLNTFSVFKDTQWEAAVTETETPRYRSTMRLGHATIEQDLPLTLNISTIERGRGGNLQ